MNEKEKTERPVREGMTPPHLQFKSRAELARLGKERLLSEIEQLQALLVIQHQSYQEAQAGRLDAEQDAGRQDAKRQALAEALDVQQRKTAKAEERVDETKQQCHELQQENDRLVGYIQRIRDEEEAARPRLVDPGIELAQQQRDAYSFVSSTTRRIPWWK